MVDDIKAIHSALFIEIQNTLNYINNKQQRFLFKDYLLEQYERIVDGLQDKYEHLLFRYFLLKHER